MTRAGLLLVCAFSERAPLWRLRSRRASPAYLGQAVKDVGHLDVLALFVVAAQLQHQVLHVRLERLLGHVLDNLRHTTGEASGMREGIR